MNRPQEKDYFEYRGKTLIMDHGSAENFMEAQDDYIDYLEEMISKHKDEMEELTEQDKKDIHLKYIINRAISKYEGFWGYREDKQSDIVEEVFKAIQKDGNET